MQFDPFWFFRLPLSGNVAEKISAPWFSPELNVNYAGDPVVEEKVVREVASFGTQIGWLNEVVLALADKVALPDKLAVTLAHMAETVKKVEAIKKANRQSALAAADAALDRLKHEQPEAYQALIQARSAGAGGR